MEEKVPQADIEASYAQVTYGYDEPEIMWVRGDELLDVLRALAKDTGIVAEFVDSAGDAIDPNAEYQLTKGRIDRM